MADLINLTQEFGHTYVEFNTNVAVTSAIFDPGLLLYVCRIPLKFIRRENVTDKRHTEY